VLEPRDSPESPPDPPDPREPPESPESPEPLELPESSREPPEPPESPEPFEPAESSPPPFAEAFFVGAPEYRRSTFAQPLPLKWIVGGANARVTGPPHSGHWCGPASLRPRNTSKRWLQDPQT
jgi:hypothetical protein